jgi:hypothetical protein
MHAAVAATPDNVGASLNIPGRHLSASEGSIGAAVSHCSLTNWTPAPPARLSAIRVKLEAVLCAAAVPARRLASLNDWATPV